MSDITKVNLLKKEEIQNILAKQYSQLLGILPEEQLELLQQAIRSCLFVQWLRTYNSVQAERRKIVDVLEEFDGAPIDSKLRTRILNGINDE